MFRLLRAAAVLTVCHAVAGVALESPPAACASLSIPEGKCWHDATHRISNVVPSPSASFCCARCRALEACQVFVHWRATGVANFSCSLYTAPAPIVACPTRVEYTAGWSSAVAPPTPVPPTPPPPAPTPPPPPGAKDVLAIFIDDMRPELGAYGCSHMHTPHMDALAMDPSTVTFDNAYVAVAWCSPSRTALLTSRRPDTSRTWSVVPTEYWRERGGNFTTLPQLFRESGYLTLGVGKTFHGGAASGNSDSLYSWSAESLPYDDAGKVCPMAKALGGAGFAAPVAQDGSGGGRLAMTPSPANGDSNLPACANATLQRIAARRRSGEDRRAFFFAVGLHKPHIPWTVPPQYYDRYPLSSVALPARAVPPAAVPPIAMNNILQGYWSNAFADFGALRANGTMANTSTAGNRALPDDYWQRRVRQAYWAALSFTDDNVGQILDAARSAGLYNDTIVILLGDHGYQLGENDQWSKVSNFEQAVRIPMMLRVPAPGAATAAGAVGGTRTSALVEAVDLLPTLADVAMGPAHVPPRCPSDLDGSRATASCTDGRSAAALVRSLQEQAGAGGARARGDTHDLLLAANWSRAAFSQVPRGALVNGEPGDVAGEEWMGYSVRVASWRYTEWVPFDNTTGRADWRPEACVGRELYVETLGDTSCRFDTDTNNVAALPENAATVAQLSALLRTIV